MSDRNGHDHGDRRRFLDDNDRETFPNGPRSLDLVVDARSIDDYAVDDRGRITIGSDHAGETVTVALIESTADDTGGWQVVDERPFECPNGHGILETESSTSVWCPDCGYSRTVIDYADEPGDTGGD